MNIVDHLSKVDCLPDCSGKSDDYIRQHLIEIRAQIEGYEQRIVALNMLLKHYEKDLKRRWDNG